ncbi:hypothetical protein [uncultured Campylobacter sp.]|uniref:hypothetical protein n=1 Tax=uncultured Campylobacter sp. TaxID=218934 RepID=UPI00261DCFB7|nr:hypothetical protein [uncultured Campylobacter sp.]
MSGIRRARFKRVRRKIFAFEILPIEFRVEISQRRNSTDEILFQRQAVRISTSASTHKI